MTARAARAPLTMTVADAFDPRANSIGFLRWLMAFLVIFSHAGPIGGFYGGHDLGVQISNEQSLGGVAVAGFFFFSGFLITRSRMGRATIFRYFWRRGLRIFPAYWAALLVTVLLFAPLAWLRVNGTVDGYWQQSFESPLTYFTNNMWLELNQRNIAGMGSDLPYAQLHGAYDWNGSAWTLLYEFRAYILVGIMGLFGMLAHRWIGGTVAVAILVLNAMTWGGVGNLVAFNPALGNPFNMMFLAPFAFGMLFTLFGDRIPVDDRLAVGALLVALYTYDVGGWNIFGQYAFCYVLMWFAIRATKLRNWERYGDFSYGVYIFAWPLMTLGAFYGLHTKGWIVYHVTIIVGVHLLAFLSWHLIEKPAMSLKNYTPAALAVLLARVRPATERARDVLTHPAYSSTRYAAQLRASETGR